MKKTLIKIHKVITKSIFVFALFVFLFSICTLDSNSWIPFIAMCTSFGYLMVHAWVYGWFHRGEREED